MRTFTRNQGYTEEDLLHFGYGHIEAAQALFNLSSTYYDSAGYLVHLGIEVVLKACHLYAFGQYEATHDIGKLFDDLIRRDSKYEIDQIHIDFLSELQYFYELRYPSRSKPVEVGSDMLAQFEALLGALWEVLPDDLIDIYDNIDPTKKGGRILMEKKMP